MGIKTPIEWCDSTVNPTMGCDGCELWTAERKICYAGKLHERRIGHPGFAPSFEEVTEFPGRMQKATEWSDLTGQPRPDKPWLDGLPRMIFVSDMSDTLSSAVSFEYMLDEIIWNVLNEHGVNHRWLWLTKRPDRMAKFSQWLRSKAKVQWPSNLWVGTSVTTQATVSRVHDLLRVGNEYTTRFVSVEPQWDVIELGTTLKQIDWVIQGGESGSIKHPFDTVWADRLRDQCQKVGVPYFLKQLGTHVIEDGRRFRLKSRKGVNWDEWPKRLRVRQMPC
jgi:protein gp37